MRGNERKQETGNRKQNRTDVTWDLSAPDHIHRPAGRGTLNRLTFRLSCCDRDRRTGRREEKNRRRTEEEQKNRRRTEEEQKENRRGTEEQKENRRGTEGEQKRNRRTEGEQKRNRRRTGEEQKENRRGTEGEPSTPGFPKRVHDRLELPPEPVRQLQEEGVARRYVVS
ncbi:hypothetical protein NHX12_012278 [Muraenolepis orangiensis]|uniref:Uncharacterized protein n=1 Tax=Muraenolepis orangiensis TaxID=630683 RepID=A0A9Q0DC73_9TELE|nr:hypothetical protein NHX12_012278 [Muraenolepis orangiensis]